jgi:hypothetical protein
VPRTRDTPRPWRLGSQVYVAFFGGVIAATAIAIENARRLRAPQQVMWSIGGAGLLGLIGVVAVAVTVSSEVRIAVQVASVAAWGLMFLAQRQWDRIYQVFSPHDEPYGSLLGPGLLAVLVGGVIQIAIVIALSG